MNALAATSAAPPAAGRDKTSAAPYQMTLYAPAKKDFDGWCATFSVTLVVDDQNVVTDVVAE